MVAPNDSVLDLEPFTTAFITLHIIGGQVGLPILILTFLLSREVTRHPTLVNFCICWVIYSIAYCLLIYAHKQHEVVHGRLCVAQAAMIHGAPAMAAVASLVVVIQIWSTLHKPRMTRILTQAPLIRLAVSLLLPYIAFAGFSIATAVIAINHPDYIGNENGLYCTVVKGAFRRYGVPVFCAVLVLIMLGFEVAISIQFYRQWRQMKRAFPLAERKPSLSLCFRVAVFSLYSWITLGACVFVLSSTEHIWTYGIQATLPLGAAVVFGTQKDLFRAWCFWKRKRKPGFKNNSDDSLLIHSLSVMGSTGPVMRTAIV